MLTDVAECFAPSGPLAHAWPDYRVRPEQSTMAAAVARALAHAEPLIVEAGTGTGKTFAYLVPALLSGRRVILSTGTRTLQDQLYHRDLPLLARALGSPVQVALLKGRANYLCRQRLELATRERALPGFERATARALVRVERWAASTKTGDLAELTELPERSPLWPRITSTRDNCLGAECAHAHHCHVLEARRAAQAADVVVVNHHLLLADLALKEEGFGDLLPGADAVILDEAHQVPEIATQFFGRAWSARQLDALRRDALAEIDAAGADAAPLVQAFDRLATRAAELARDLGGRAPRVDWAALPAAFVDGLEDLGAALGALAADLEALGAGAGVGNCARRARASAEALAGLIAAEDELGVRWAEAAAGGFALQFTPFEVAARLREAVEASGATWVFTSATLAIAGDFSHFAARVGFEDARTLAIASPFDFREQALRSLPPGMPDPATPA
jgi:ATP-dependent DNA helicase DinG